MNLVVMSGRLTDEPSRTFTSNGKWRVQVRIAVSKRFKKDNKPTADFFNCVAWDKDAENIFRFFHKGDVIFVKGRMENDNYTNKDGQMIYGDVLVVDEWDFGPKKLGREDSQV